MANKNTQVIEVVTKGANKSKQQLNGVSKGLGQLAKQAAVAAGAYFGARALLSGIQSSVDLFAQQELAEKKLEAALGKTSQKLLNQAKAIQQVTMFGDEQVIEAQALIGSFVREEKAIMSATQATLDLAAAKGMELTVAADLVSKTLGSSTNALSRYGIEVTGAVGSTERLESLTGNLAKVFGGQATEQANTLAGQMQQMKNAMGDAGEEIGNFLSPAIEKSAGFFKSASEKVGSFFRSLTETKLDTTIRLLESLNVESESLIRLKNLQLDSEIKKLNTELQKSNKEGLTAEQIEARLDAIQQERIKNAEELGDIMLTTTGEERQVLRLKSKSLAVGMKGMQFSKDAESVARRVKEVNAERLEIDKQTGDFQERTLENLTREENRLLELIEPITQINMLKAQQLKIEKDIKETQNVNEDVDVEPFTKDEDAEFFGEDEKKSFDDYSEAMFNKMVVDEQAKQQEEERLRLRKQFIATYPEEAAQLKMFTEEQAKLEKIKEKFSLKAKAVKIRETLSNTFQGANALYKQYVSTYPPPLGQIIGAAAYIATIQKGKKDVEQIKKAQYGADFVTSGPEIMMVGEGSGPERVQVTPLVDPNIDGPQGQGATINITGNVMSDDFVENTLIEKIREATRMGENLGI